MKSHEKKGGEKGVSCSKNGPQTFKPTFQRFLKACHPAMTSNPGTLLSSAVAERERLWEPEGDALLVPPPPRTEEETEAQGEAGPAHPYDGFQWLLWSAEEEG